MADQKDPRKRRPPGRAASDESTSGEKGEGYAGVKDAGTASHSASLAKLTTLDPMTSHLIGVNLCLRSMNSLLRHLASPASPSTSPRNESSAEARLPLTPHVRRELFAIVHFISERSDQMARELLEMQHKRKG